MALTFITESVASAIIENLVNTCSSYLMAYPAASGMQDDLNRLDCALLQVQTVLIAVEEYAPVMVQNKGLDKWLWQLRDAVENAEDVLDELEYYELKKRIQDGDGQVRGNILSKCKIKIGSFINHIFPDDTLERLKEAVKVLNKVIDSMGPFLKIAIELYGPSVKRQKLEEVKNASETSCLLTESEVFGRDKERDAIVEWLIKPVDGESEGITFNVSAYTIVGMGGLGKTTLAQLIHQDERVQRYFDPIIWVCVSQDFNAATVIRKMLKDENSGKSLNALHEDLKQKLTSNRFLLILDDVWNEDNMSEWEKLVAPLKFGQRGSKIMLTTRMGSVADMAARVMEYKSESLDLKELEEFDCMSLFNKYAFLGVNPDDYKNLQPTGEQIVKKLGGCPLAIKVMGGLLNSYKDYDYWNRILKEDTMELQQGKYGIMTVLRLSYDHLPINLQVCFRYCSIFPQDYEFNRKELVYMWMGSGLIPQSICGRRRSPEDIGREYFNLLTRKSFFTCKTQDFRHNGHKIYKHYVMHDLLHDLARSVSQGECIRIEGDVAGNIIPKTVRHLSFENINLLSIGEIPNLKNLRTLFISSYKVKLEQYANNLSATIALKSSYKEKHEHNADHLPVFNKVIKGFKNLRLLSLEVDFEFNKSLDALDSLIHLRYLRMWSILTPKEDFFLQPLYRLYHLVVMKFWGGTSRFHKNIEYDGLTNLVNLRSLDAHRFVIEKIPYVSKLPFIRKLEDFIVREKSGYKISELKNLRDLHHLCIRGLENVRSPEEAMDAKLNEKEYLKSLTLGWFNDSSNSVETDEQLLDNLRPHVNLKRLCIERYQGVNSPSWMSDLSLINNLTSIELMCCKGWEHLPPLGQLPFLNHLKLSGLHAVKKIDSSFFGSSGGGCAFPSLKELYFEDLPNLEEWIGTDDCCMFPKLHTMTIINCPNLSGLPTLPCCLRKLHIFNVGLTALPAIYENCGNNNQQEHFSALENFTIEQCDKLEYIPTEVFQKFNTVEVLIITNCPKLTTRGISDIQLPSILNKLFIGSCGGLEVQLMWSANLTSLILLELVDCKSITSLPPAQVCAQWTMLSHLIIKNCKELSSFGGKQALVSLHYLEIRGCDKLIEVALRQPPFSNDVGQKNAADCFLKLGTLVIDHHALLLMEPLRSLSSISSLILSDASRLTSLPEWLLQNHSTLKELRIWNAVSLQSLPQSMTQLCSLESLYVDYAKLIQSLPDLPTSLRFLCITGCHPVLKERCQENIGLDWPKIANISRVEIELANILKRTTQRFLHRTRAIRNMTGLGIPICT